MGSPLRLALVNVFMGSNEQKWLKSDRDRLVKFYHRHVNDIFYLFDSPRFFKQDSNLNFNIEKEHLQQTPFSDVLNTRSDRLITSVIRKVPSQDF